MNLKREDWVDVLHRLETILERLVLNFEVGDMVEEWMAAQAELNQVRDDLVSMRRYQSYKFAVVKPGKFPLAHRWADTVNKGVFGFNI